MTRTDYKTKNYTTTVNESTTCLLKRFLLSELSLFFVQKNWVQPRLRYWEHKAKQRLWSNNTLYQLSTQLTQDTNLIKYTCSSKPNC